MDIGKEMKDEGGKSFFGSIPDVFGLFVACLSEFLGNSQPSAMLLLSHSVALKLSLTLPQL